MHAVTHAVSITTNASGAGSGYTPVCNGRIQQIRYVKTDFDNGSTFAVTTETSGVTVWGESAVNASATRVPRQATHSTAGVAALYAAGGTAVNDHVVVADERIAVAVTSGGNTKSGTFYITVG